MRAQERERERVIRVNFLKNEFLLVTTRNQLHHGVTATARRSSRIIECITKRNRILDALNSLQTATQACVTVLQQSCLATRSNDSDPQLHLWRKVNKLDLIETSPKNNVNIFRGKNNAKIVRNIM